MNSYDLRPLRLVPLDLEDDPGHSISVLVCMSQPVRSPIEKSEGDRISAAELIDEVQQYLGSPDPDNPEPSVVRIIFGKL
jgi:hypothetical protein